jgi:hypothetical protein
MAQEHLAEVAVLRVLGAVEVAEERASADDVEEPAERAGDRDALRVLAALEVERRPGHPRDRLEEVGALGEVQHLGGPELRLVEPLERGVVRADEPQAVQPRHGERA